MFASNKCAFESIGTKIAVMDPQPLHIANNKGLLLSAMKAAALPTAQFVVVNDVKAVEEAVFRLGYPEKPVIVKPTVGNGSRGTRVLDATKSRYEQFFFEKPSSPVLRIEELMAILKERTKIPEMIVMEFLPGQELCVDVLADHGKIAYISSRVGVAVSSIMQTNEVKLVPEAIKLATRVVELLNLSGNIDFDMKSDSTGIPHVLEINPRLPAGIAVEAIAGINFPYLGIKQLLGEELPRCNIREGVKMQFCNSELFFDECNNPIYWNK